MRMKRKSCPRQAFVRGWSRFEWPQCNLTVSMEKKCLVLCELLILVVVVVDSLTDSVRFIA